MANLTITASSVAAATSAEKGDGTAGETITAGMPLYQAAADGKYYKAISSSSAAATVAGISLHAALSGQPIQFIKSGNLTAGASMTRGMIYSVSATAGAIMPYTDYAAGQYVSRLGVAANTTVLVVGIANSGVARSQSYLEEAGV